jgi:GGDEF domain-containing protein
MTDSEQLSALHSAVTCYLSTLLAVANCLKEACPEVGEPYRHRLSRLRSRLAFDANPDAIEEGRAVVESELKEYAARVATYIDLHGVEVRRASAALEQVVQSLAQRQEFYGARLRHFAAQMENTSYPAEPEHLGEVVALQVAGLLSLVESMGHETHSLVQRMHDELADIERRLAEAEVTDRVTGLMKRREMERQIKSRQESGAAVTLLLFELSGEINDEIARQAGARLSTQFRYRDLVCRWTDSEFMVLFHGTPQRAQSRAEQVVPWLDGTYRLEGGDSVEISAGARLVRPEQLEAT